MSHLEILAGHINALLDGLRILVIFVGVVSGLVCALILIVALICGDGTVRLAVGASIGCFLVSLVLAPRLPYGNIIGACIIGLGVLVAYWILVYD
jgi:hypothetical protein